MVDSDPPAPSAEDGDTIMKQFYNVLDQTRGNGNSESSGSTNGGNNSDNSALASLFGFNFDSEEGMPRNESSGSNEDSNESNEDSDNGASPKRAEKMEVEAASTAASNLATLVNSFSLKNLEKKKSGTNDKESDSGGYNTDADEKKRTLPEDTDPATEASNHSTASTARKKKRPEGQRRERNQREKQRSLKITTQLGELRNLLSAGGVNLPDTTKSCVLTETAKYISLMQQNQLKSELDRLQLVQQLQEIGQGANGSQAAVAIRHFAAQNGVWALGNFGGIPPDTAAKVLKREALSQEQEDSDVFSTKAISIPDYRFVYDSCGVAMAIASLAGSFLDCNQLFCQLSEYTKQDLCSKTLFNLTVRQDLQKAFAQSKRLLSPTMNEFGEDSDSTDTNHTDTPLSLRGAKENRVNLGMKLTLVKGKNDIPKYFCITLVHTAGSPQESDFPASFSDVSAQASEMCAGVTSKIVASHVAGAPSYTAG